MVVVPVGAGVTAGTGAGVAGGTDTTGGPVGVFRSFGTLALVLAAARVIEGAGTLDGGLTPDTDGTDETGGMLTRIGGVAGLVMFWITVPGLSPRAKLGTFPGPTPPAWTMPAGAPRACKT